MLQVTHVRSLHSGGRRQQQEAVAVDSEPEPFSVFRTQESDPVSKTWGKAASDTQTAYALRLNWARVKQKSWKLKMVKARFLLFQNTVFNQWFLLLFIIRTSQKRPLSSQSIVSGSILGIRVVGISKTQNRWTNHHCYSTHWRENYLNTNLYFKFFFKTKNQP